MQTPYPCILAKIQLDAPLSKVRDTYIIFLAVLSLISHLEKKKLQSFDCLTNSLGNIAIPEAFISDAIFLVVYLYVKIMGCNIYGLFSFC